MEFIDLLPVESGRSANLVYSIVEFLPKLAMAVVVWILAWFIAGWLRKAILRSLEKIKLDSMAEKAQVNDFLHNANFSGGLTGIIGAIVFWIIYLVGINMSFDILGLQVISTLISDLIAYIPNLLIAVIVMLVGAFIAKFIKDLTDGAVATAKMKHTWLGHVVYVIIMLFAIVTALKQAQVDISFLTDNINTIVMGVMLAFGLAFGLGGKDKAKDIIEKYLK